MVTGRQQKLRVRINAAIWIACSLTILFIGVLFYGFERQTRVASVDQIRELMGAVYNQKQEELANELFADQRDAMMITLEEIRNVRGIRAVQVYRLDGELYATAGQATEPLLSSEDAAGLADGPFFREFESKGRRLAIFASPVEVIGERFGLVALTFDLTEITDSSRRRLWFILAVFGGTLAVVSIVLWIHLTRSVIHPVSRIQKAMRLVLAGNLGEQVTLDRHDEIGQMAAVFNTMSKQLHEQHESLAQSMIARDADAQQLEAANLELANLNASLETIVDDRTRELRSSYEQLQAEAAERQRADTHRRRLEERLARSQKMEALGLLAGGVAHDLNNVLSGIVSYPDLLLMQLPEESPLREPLLTIQGSGRRAAAIVKDLLTLARRGVTHTEVIDFNEFVVQSYIDSPEHQKLCRVHPNVTMEVQLASDLMPIQGSPFHLRKTLMNLVINAAEAQPDGGRVMISTESRYVDRPFSGYDRVVEGDYSVLVVEDFGTGIDPDDMERIFEPFYTKKIMGRSGTGLGMAVVWGTVQDHYGYIHVKSKPGEGARFELFFPVSRSPLPDAPDPTSPVDYAGRGESVLVVDDVPEQRTIATSLLGLLGYRVTAVDSGESAIEYLGGNSADILVLDMIMDPGMDGLDTFLAIIDRHPGQRAIIASGFAENERVKKAQAAGAGAYVRKPYTLEKIGMALRAELDRGRDTFRE